MGKNTTTPIFNSLCDMDYVMSIIKRIIFQVLVVVMSACFSSNFVLASDSKPSSKRSIPYIEQRCSDFIVRGELSGNINILLLWFDGVRSQKSSQMVAVSELGCNFLDRSLVQDLCKKDKGKLLSEIYDVLTHNKTQQEIEDCKNMRLKRAGQNERPMPTMDQIACKDTGMLKGEEIVGGDMAAGTYLVWLDGYMAAYTNNTQTSNYNGTKAHYDLLYDACQRGVNVRLIDIVRDGYK